MADIALIAALVKALGGGGGGGGGGDVKDIRVNNVSILNNGIANFESDTLDFTVTVSGATPAITAVAGTQYICGEVSTIDITVPESGIIDVIFESGSTPAVLTVTPPTGVTDVLWPSWFDPDNLDANSTYEISIENGKLGVVAVWG